MSSYLKLISNETLEGLTHKTLPQPMRKKTFQVASTCMIVHNNTAVPSVLMHANSYERELRSLVKHTQEYILLVYLIPSHWRSKVQTYIIIIPRPKCKKFKMVMLEIPIYLIPSHWRSKVQTCIIMILRPKCKKFKMVMLEIPILRRGH